MSWLDKQQNPELALHAKEMREEVAQALLSLSPRMERVIRKRFGFFEEATQHEIAGEFGVSNARISSLEIRALRHLRFFFVTHRIKFPSVFEAL